MVRYSGDEKKKILLKTDAFIQTSKSEGQSLALLEAFSLGIPCIITPGTNFVEIVKEHNMGYGCNLDKNSIGRAIQEAFDNRNQLQEMSNNAFEYTKNNYNWNQVIQTTLKKYKEILNEIQ